MTNDLPVFIDTPDQLQKVYPDLEASSMIAIDTELDSFYSYEPQICLVQISTPDKDYIFDPLALDLTPLAPLFSKPERTAIFHAGSNDIPHLRAQFGFNFARIFDTYLAAGALNRVKRGLAPLLEEYFGIVLDKQYQRADWRMRPLTPAMLQYARHDTAHLFDLREALLRELIENKRLKVAEYAFRQAINTKLHPKVVDADGWAKIKGLDGVPKKYNGIVRELYLWREHEAQRVNLQPVRVMTNQLLLRLAINAPHSEQEIRANKDISHLEKYPNQATAIYNAIVKGRKIGYLPLPQPKRNRRLNISTETKRRLHALKEWRTSTLKHDDIAPEFLLSNSDIFALGQREWRDVEELKQSQLLPDYVIEQYGAALVKLIHDAN